MSGNDRDKACFASWRSASSSWASRSSPRMVPRDVLEDAGLQVERVYKVKEGRPNVVDLIKGERIQLIINTPHGLEPWFDEKAIRRAAIMARIPTITTLSAAKAACDGIAALQGGTLSVFALQELHAAHVHGPGVVHRSARIAEERGFD